MKRVLLGFFVIGCFMLLVACGGQSKTESPAQTNQSQSTSAVEPPVAVQEPVQTASIQPQSQQQSQVLNETTLVGTKWQAGPYTLEFQANGVAIVNNGMQGQWSVEGNALKVSAAGTTYTAEIRGDKLFYGGMELTRLN